MSKLSKLKLTYYISNMITSTIIREKNIRNKSINKRMKKKEEINKNRLVRFSDIFLSLSASFFSVIAFPLEKEINRKLYTSIFF